MTSEFREPDGFEWGHFKDARGADIRYGHVKPAGEVKGAVVLLQGFRESAEKYFEVIDELLARGLEVWTMDWRGQGGSERYLKDTPQRAHHEGYGEQIETLHQFTQSVVNNSEDKPLLMVAHSMGAHIGLRYLKEHPGIFDSAALTAPMLDINTGTLPKPLARQMAKFAKAGNYLEKYVPGGSDWCEEKNLFDKNDKTSDPARFQAALDLLHRDPALKIGDATYGWVYHTFQSVDVLNDEAYLKSIQTPILMEISGEERVVSRDAQVRAAELLPQCKRVDIKEARHEIWQERGELRDAWMKAFDSFLAERLEPLSPAPKKPSCHTAADPNRSVLRPPVPRGPSL